MNFRSTDNNKAEDSLYMIKKFIEQYLKSEEPDKAKTFKSLCLIQIQEIIDRDLELEESRRRLSYLLAEYEKRVIGIFDKIQNLYRR